MDEGPTTEHGPLSTQPAMLEDRLITAQFATPQAAAAARDQLVAAGIPASSIGITAHPAEHPGIAAEVRPADDTVLGRLREAILPDEASAAARAAVAHDDAVLNVTPTRDQVETVVRILSDGHPTRFDADLERWRNKG